MESIEIRAVWINVCICSSTYACLNTGPAARRCATISHQAMRSNLCGLWEKQEEKGPLISRMNYVIFTIIMMTQLN